MNAREKKRRLPLREKQVPHCYQNQRRQVPNTGNTHLQSHWDVLLADIMVVLVSVQHNNRIGQGKAGITISKWGPI